MKGKEIIEMGYAQSYWFGEALDHINSSEMTKDEVVSYLDSMVELHKKIEPHKDPVPYSVNIRAYSEEEVDNVSQVHSTMNELMKTPTVVDGAVMPDACPTGEVGQIPVGGVVVAKNAIHPSMHSADICCSVMATSFMKEDPEVILNAANRRTHFGYGANDFLVPKLPEGLLEEIKGNRFLNDEKSISLAKSGLGTQGDGNHFLFVGVSEKGGETMMVTHHGSRGFGANLFRKGMRVAERYRKQLSPKTLKRNAWIPYDTEDGKEYWKALQIVREWTKLNHEIIHNAVSAAMGIYTDKPRRFWNEHNFVFKKGDLFYHAKGATPLSDEFVPDSFRGLRLIPLNMKEPVLIVKGETTDSNLGFAPHGAGRNISRSAHKRKFDGMKVEDIVEMETEGIDARFYSGVPDISELPSAYKNAEEVQSQMVEYGLGEVVDKILPYGCIMAGDLSGTEPWKNRSSQK